MSTRNVLVTGSNGFIGKNLIAALGREKDIAIMTFDLDDEPGLFEAQLKEADFIYHFAGVNRPQNSEEFKTGNADSTAIITNILEKSKRKVPILLTSSIQAERDNPYGVSKKAAEDILIEYSTRTGAPVYIYRLPGVFGKWSRPNYNTVVATFCHNIARGIDIKISDPSNEIELVYIDDVVRHFMGHIKEFIGTKTPPSPQSSPSRGEDGSKSSLYSKGEDGPKNSPPLRGGDEGEGGKDDSKIFYKIDRTFKVTLGELAERIRTIHDIQMTLTVPDLSDDFTRCLHATYLSFLPEEEFSYPVKLNTDNRGWLFELIKSPHFGQIFVSKTLPGITRGNHYHDSKIEKFCVVQGEGVIRFRHILSKELIEYAVDGTAIQILDIPPGYTHSIENTGKREMITLFWANQIFDPTKPDTYYSDVITKEPEE